jgi:hypothetical protein
MMSPPSSRSTFVDYLPQRLWGGLAMVIRYQILISPPFQWLQQSLDCSTPENGFGQFLLRILFFSTISMVAYLIHSDFQSFSMSYDVGSGLALITVKQSGWWRFAILFEHRPLFKFWVAL